MFASQAPYSNDVLKNVFGFLITFWFKFYFLTDDESHDHSHEDDESESSDEDGSKSEENSQENSSGKFYYLMTASVIRLACQGLLIPTIC